MIAVSDAIAEVRTPVALSLWSNHPIFFCRMLLYKTSLMDKVTFVPRIPKLSFWQKGPMKDPRATMHITLQYHLTSVSIQRSFPSRVSAWMSSIGTVKIPKSLEKKMENTGCMPPVMHDPITATNIKMHGRLYLSSLLKPLCCFCYSFHAFSASSFLVSSFWMASIISCSIGVSLDLFMEVFFFYISTPYPTVANSFSSSSSSISMGYSPTASASADCCLAQKLA